MSDVLVQLLSASWRGVEFPVTRMRSSLAHDLVEHKYWGVDGARVEDTGLAPWRHTFTVPLIRGLTPGRAERWADLYPTVMRKLADAFQQRSSGMLQHPEWGLVLCKGDKMDLDWDAVRRGGTDVEVSFVETLPADVDQEVRESSPVQAADASVGTLDSATVKRDMTAIFKAKGIELPPYMRTSPFSFTDAMQKIKAIADYPDLADKRLSGQINAFKYHAEALGRSASSARSPKTWPVARSVEQVKAAAHEMEQKAAAGRRKVAFFTVSHDTTLSGVARQIPEATVGDLMRLNPELMTRPEILRGTVVRHYLPQRQAA